MAYSPDFRPSQFVDFDRIQIDDKVELSHQLTKADVDAFAALTGDFNPLHIDENYAGKTQFRKPVVHGMLSASFISTLIGMFLPGRGSLWLAQSIEFINPAYVGDTLTVTAQVKQKSEATRLLVLNISITNQHGQKLISGQSTVRQPEPQKEHKLMLAEDTMIVLITGAGGGIGSAVALKLAEQGYAVIVADWHLDKAKYVADAIKQNGGQAQAVQVDVANIEEVNTLFSYVKNNLGPVQAIVHCASPRNELNSFDELAWESVQQHLNVQLGGAYNCAKAALPDMIVAQSGDLVFLGSSAVDNVPPAQQADYIVAKAALTALARCLAVEYGPKGIRVNVVAPGMTQTDMIAHLPDKAKMLTKMQTPLRRLATPADIANVVTFLLKPESHHITGETIRVNGGVVMQ